MSVRIHLYTLGDARITIGAKEVRPTSPMVFAALLYLGLERGRRVPRTALQELLFPETGERSGAHSVRQLLYKLRQLGVPLASHDSALELPAQAVVEDMPSAERLATDHLFRARCTAGLVPGYAPGLSEAFDEWLDEQRARVITRCRAAMLDALAKSREAADHLAMDAIASAILAMDPLNEEATLVRAEVLALSGQKHDAVRVLERYSAEVGTTSPDLRIPAEVLRRRIAERFHASERDAVPMLGRQEELSFLLAQFARAQDGQGTVSVVWGDAGIGKTRLVQEFSAQLVLKNARVESAHCQPFDRERPLGALVDLVPKLLQARGALGVSPDSMQHLRRLSGDVPADQPADINPELTAARIREAIADLLACVSSERPLVLLVEDAHWLDEASLRLLLRLIPGQLSRLHLVITMRDRPRFPAGTRISESVVVRQLAPLSEPLAGDLLTRALGAGYPLSDGVREQCLSLAAGNPLFICTVAEHLRLRGSAPSAQAGIADLLKQRIRILDAPTLLLLRTIAALGNHATPDRLRACTGMSLEVELLSLQELADRGLIARQNGAIKCTHDLLTEVVLGDAPEAIRIALYERVATVLEEDGTAGRQVQLLWACAESWTRAGSRPQACDAFQKCAHFAVDIGQPQFACAALQRAQELADGIERLTLVMETINVAESCVNIPVLLENVKRYRLLHALHATRKSDTHAIDLSEINALRWRLESTWDHCDKLVTIARDHTASSVTRIRATSLFLLAAEQELRRDEAVAFFDDFDWEPLRAASPPEFYHMSLLYHATFGNLCLVAELTAELMRILPQMDEWRQCSILGNVGMALFRAGAVDQSLGSLEQSIHKASRLGMTSFVLNSASRLCSAYFLVGDNEDARKWHTYTEQCLGKLGLEHTPAFLSNAIDQALVAGDHGSARQLFSRLSTEHGLQSTPYNRRFYIAYNLLIGRYEDTFELSAEDFHTLSELDRQGRDMSDHDFCAFTLAGARAARGQGQLASEELDRYLATSRRERYGVCPLLTAHWGELRARNLLT